MRIQNIYLFQSPFDSSYTNVPSDMDGVLEKGGSLKVTYYSWLLKNCSPTSVIDVYADAFADNINETVRIKISDTKTIRNKNYATLVTDDPYDSDKFYFITSYKLLNAMAQPTIELTLLKDIWTECYDTAITQSNAKFAITQQHLNMISSVGTVSEMYQNIVENGVSSVVFSETWGAPVVLWAVFKCDPTVTYYTGWNSYTPVGGYAPNPSYGTYQYFYYAVGIIRKGYIEPVGRPYDNHSYSLYIPRIQGPFLLSQQLTVHVPFEYTLTTRSEGGYNVLPAIAHNDIYYKDNATNSYYSIDAWSGDNETEFCYYNEDTTTTVRQYHYRYDVDNEQYGNYYNSLENIQYSPYMRAYPFKYYTLTLPGGKNITFDGAIPISSIDVYITPTDSGGIITVNAVTTDNNSLFIGDQTFINYEVTGDIPKSVDAYLDYMSRAGASMREEKRYEKQRATVDAIKGLTEGITNVGVGAVNASGGNSLKGIGQIAQGVTQIGTSVADYAMESSHINKKYDAKMADLSTTTVTKFQSSNQLNSSPFFDMPVIYKHVVINNDINRVYQLNFIKYGTVCQRVDNPLTDYRKYFNFVKSTNANYTSIGNSVYRSIFNSILNNGVTKWSIRRYNNNVLDWFVDNQQL